jgi:hypothetical protein
MLFLWLAADSQQPVALLSDQPALSGNGEGFFLLKA